jgi:hypothetical protein
MPRQKIKKYLTKLKGIADDTSKSIDKQIFAPNISLWGSVGNR